MDVVTPRRSARKLFPDSPKRIGGNQSLSDEETSSDDTLGPMSPLSPPTRVAQIATPKKNPLVDMIFRRSPRISVEKHRQATVLAASSPMSVDETPAKIPASTDLTPLGDMHQGSMIKRFIVEESPDVIGKTPVNKNPPSKVSASTREAKYFSPTSGITCGSFYSSKPKARLSLFADVMSQNMGGVKGIKRTHSDNIVKKTSMKAAVHLKRPKNEPCLAGKSVRHGIKKPKPKTSSKKPLNITPAKKMPLIIPKDRLQTFLDTAEIDDLIADINHPEQRLKILVDDDDDEDMDLVLHLSSQSEDTESGDDVNVQNRAKILPLKVESPEADPKKKFFKTNRTMEINRTATITVDKNIKIQVSNGKFSLQKAVAKTGKNPLKTRQCPTHSAFAHTEAQVHKKVLDILVNLDEIPSDNEIADSYVVLADGNDQIAKDDSVLMSPGQTMAGITSSASMMAIVGDESGLLLPGGNGPMSSSSLSHGACENGSDSSGTKAQLFPLFYKGKAAVAAIGKSPIRRGTKRPFRTLENDQYQLDAGQRRWGATQCSECGVVYQMGDPDDERNHLKHHDGFLHLKHVSWKSERVVAKYDTGRVIAVYPGDSKAWWNKVMQVLEVVDRELGYVETNVHDLKKSKVYIYIFSSRVVGCLLSQPVEQAYKMLPYIAEGVDCVSVESYPVKVGISRLWTAQDMRRMKVASRLVDAMRSNHAANSMLKLTEFAFSPPTLNGKDFAENYTKCHDFLVYM